MNDVTTTVVLNAVRAQAMTVARRMGLRDAARCDEVAQEVMVRAWHHGVHALAPRARGAWVRTTARRCALDALRAAVREGAGDGAGLAAHGDAAMSEGRLDARRRLAAMLARAAAMPPSLRAVFVAVVCEGRSIDEVARALSISRAAIDTRLRRMRGELGA